MNKLLIIGGPTGIGKSALAVKLGLRYDAVIIGADSMQIYKGMNIGTGKITDSEMCGIQHTMIDIVPPNEQYSVQRYVLEAKKIILKAHCDGRLPIVVGGTGLYINAIINEQNFAQAPPNEEVRRKYYDIYSRHGAEYLHSILENVDPKSAISISVRDVRRTVRALEIYEQTGQAKSSVAAEKKSDYDIKFYIPELPRAELYERINRRVDNMFRDGLIDEIMGLKQYWHCRSMQAIGYKEIIDAIQAGENPLEAAELIKQNSRRYAKRQITFFKWISAEKTFVEKDFFEHVIETSDRWLEENV